MIVLTVEECILNYDALPKEMLGWRRYRIEYGGHAQDCLMESTIYLPPHANIREVERQLNL